ncbi:CPBP family intramembrane glutamic endopeptidase [Anabaena subtropica]|uniref:CPBP family intramembrane metalloprotease n=1 Tax=Anabaena subtropica FACHB-260 TaxID=2692884 RepID=A0ABR8CS95_9NOST|nr:type II CAAX endopeptidase family protein [Anabaena subtropica]MBD2344655.1 CPBP family intramembrane metalloprotease [Anabaena subtropica FACHB-260]
MKDASAIVVVMAFFLIWLGCWLPIAAISLKLLNWQPIKPLQPEQKLPLMVSLYLLAPLVLWGVIWLTNGSFVNYGIASNFAILSSFTLGFGLGVLSIATLFSCQFWLGWCNFQELNIKQLASISLPILLIAVLVGGIEELVFRGFLLTELERDYPVWTAGIISSLIFAVLHLIWEQKETLPQLPGLWLLGMMLVLARISDRGNLGIAWGLHSALVWAIATIDTAQLVTYTGKVSEWWTGKNKKPLAGVAGILCVLGTSLILWLFSVL